MYNLHATEIQSFAQKSANNLFNVILMVALSIQQRWDTVGNQMQDVKANGLGSKYLWGNKVKTYKYLLAKKHFIYAQAMAVINSKHDNDTKALKLMEIFLRVDGLGLAKAGFVCQLFAGLVGCIDTHNIRMYQLDANKLKYSNNIKCVINRRSKINNYIKLCGVIGTEKLWNNWCNYLALRNPKAWKDGYHVSAAHVSYAKGEALGG